MDKTVLIALITTCGSIIVALIAIIPHFLKKSESPPPPPVGTSHQIPQDAEEASDDETVGRSRREETMKVLFRHGCISPGDVIEPMPQALPVDDASDNLNRFRVRIGNPPKREVVWMADNQMYSLTKLSDKLSKEHGLQWFKPHTFELWRIVGDHESLWDKAERLLQQEVGC